MSNSVAKPTILILGRIGVAMIGGAAVLSSALGLVRALADPDSGRSSIIYGLAFGAFPVGTVAGATGRTWGATIVAAIYGALGLLLVWFTVAWSAAIQPLTILLPAASVVVLAAAVALRRAGSTRNRG
jgi:hypothetical protein